MTKEEIIYKIEQIAHNGAFHGVNADYVERQAEKLAEKIVKLFDIHVVRLSLFNEVYDKFVECEDDDEFTQYLNKNTNEA